jgi:hypothetical protein
MEAKGAALNAPPTDEDEGGEERPEWLPEKFKSPQDLAKAYDELQKKLSGQKPEAPPADPAKPKVDPLAIPDADAAAAAVSDAGLNFDDFTKEFETSGALSEASYEKLTKAGIPKAVVDSYIAGQVAQAAAVRSEVVSTVGGDESYSKMVAWAAKTLPASEVQAYNRVMESADPDTLKLAVAGLHAKFQAANPVEPQLISGGTGRAGEDAFESTQQLVVAMRDPRYKNDPAYRKSVERRLAKSSIF